MNYSEKEKIYKKGDKVRLRDDLTYPDYMEKRLKETNYVVTVDDDIITNMEEYCFEEIPGVWTEKSIVNSSNISTPIYSRFEILDL